MPQTTAPLQAFHLALSGVFLVLVVALLRRHGITVVRLASAGKEAARTARTAAKGAVFAVAAAQAGAKRF